MLIGIEQVRLLKDEVGIGIAHYGIVGTDILLLLGR